jgi:hypothetical protein
VSCDGATDDTDSMIVKSNVSEYFMYFPQTSQTGC